MIGKGLFILTALSTCVLSLPVTLSQLENEDVKVMKCVVEALADVLSRPQPIPVSQECLVILKTDDRLVTILRHHNFLKELQEIAVQGDQERTQPQTDAASPLDPPTPTPQATEASDRSMLEALGGPGERSILSQKKRTGNRDGDKGESPRDGESLGEGDIIDEVQVKREEDESPGSHISEAEEDRSEGKAEKREEEEEEEVEEGSKEKRGNSEEENMTMNEKGASTEKRDRHKSKEQTLDEKDEEEKEKRSSHFAKKRKEEQEEDVKRGSRENLKRWSKRGKGLQLKKKAHEEEEAEEGNSQQEVPHHSKEVPDDDEGQKKKKKRGGPKSPEEKELQMISKRAPEEKGLEEEGSASRKSEEPEIESLAAIESELENVAQKLHELRRG